MDQPADLSFFGRLGLACKVLFNAEFARSVFAPAKSTAPVAPVAAPKAAAAVVAPEKAQAPALFVLSVLQREGRFLDFLQQDIAEFPDADIGAAARVIHAGCKKGLKQYLTINPVLKDPEGAVIGVQKGFNPQQIRLTGNVAGEPPYRGTLKHHGWIASEVRFPNVQESIDPNVLAPAEVELT